MPRLRMMNLARFACHAGAGSLVVSLGQGTLRANTVIGHRRTCYRRIMSAAVVARRLRLSDAFADTLLRRLGASWGGAPLRRLQVFANAKQHVLAPPAHVSGTILDPPVLSLEDGINEELLAALSKMEGSDEADVWETIEACIAPLATLRLTVQAWAGDGPLSDWKREVAENMMLLLDPAVIADSRQLPPKEPTRALEDAYLAKPQADPDDPHRGHPVPCCTARPVA